MHLSRINDILNKVLVRSKSADHDHVLVTEPVKGVRPIWLHGFPRSAIDLWGPEGRAEELGSILDQNATLLCHLR